MALGHLGSPVWTETISFSLVLSFFPLHLPHLLAPVPWVAEESYYCLILGVGIQLFTYS